MDDVGEIARRLSDGQRRAMLSALSHMGGKALYLLTYRDRGVLVGSLKALKLANREGKLSVLGLAVRNYLKGEDRDDG